MILLVHAAVAGTLYVDQSTGNDDNPGTSPDLALATLTHAATLLGAGDALVVGPGTYYEQPVFDGGDGQIWIRAEPMGEATISGAWPEAAEGTVGWRDEGDGTWSAEGDPAVFGEHEGVFLFRFNTPEDLAAGRAGAVDVPDQGFAHADGRVYVRLPGDLDPNGESVLLSGGTWGEDGALDAVVWIQNAPGAILEGFRIEGSGTQCVWMDPTAPGGTVRNTVLSACHFGLVLPDDTLVEWVEYTYPGFYDFAESLRQLNGSVETVYTLVKEYHPTVVLEGGLAVAHGWTGETTDRCEFRYNYLHEAFDGEKLGFFSSSSSHHNVYLYNYDNHVEMEGGYGLGSADLHLHHNLMLACPLGPISHQSTDLVGPQYVYNNVVMEWDLDHGHTWTQLKTVAPNATGGLYFFHNLFWSGHTTMFYEDADRLQLRNNLLVFTDEYSTEPPHFDSDHNLLVNDDDEPWLRGDNGAWLGSDPAALALADVEALDFRPLATSPAVDAGVAIPGFNGEDPDIGPFELGATWEGAWPRPMATTFDCSVPERWAGDVPELACEEDDLGQQDTDPGGGDSSTGDTDPIDSGTAHTDEADRQDDEVATVDVPPAASGCACETSRRGGWPWWVVLAGIAWRRRGGTVVVR